MILIAKLERFPISIKHKNDLTTFEEQIPTQDITDATELQTLTDTAETAAKTIETSFIEKRLKVVMMRKQKQT